MSVWAKLVAFGLLSIGVTDQLSAQSQWKRDRNSGTQTNRVEPPVINLAVSNPASSFSGGGWSSGSVFYGHGNYYPITTGSFYYSGPSYSSYVIDSGSGQFGPYVGLPIVMPAETMYGPQAVQRFMGVDPIPGDRPFRPQHDAGAGSRSALQPSSPVARQNAAHYIDVGDKQFALQKYAQALDRYLTAGATASDMAEAYFRQGFAYIAMSHYDAAAKAFRRGYTLDADWADSDFRLDQIYGDDRLAKASHLEALTKGVVEHPQDPDLQCLLGVLLYFDGKQERAGVAFRRAAELYGPNGSENLQGFLKKLPPPANQDPKKQVVRDDGLDI